MVEVWNEGGFGATDIEQVLKWTERNFYDRGLFPAAISGLDDHGPDHKTTVLTMVDSGGSTDRGTTKTKHVASSADVSSAGRPCAWSAQSSHDARRRISRH
jgi:hypothetical protein